MKTYDNFPVVGRGVFGTVYKIKDRVCLKVNKSAKNNCREIELYDKYGESPLFPKIHGHGEKYIVMELIEGTSLRDYLDRGQVVDEKWLFGLLKMFEEGQKSGLDLNPNARHIILTERGIRLIDLEDIEKLASPKPYMLFHRLKEYDQKKLLMRYVRKHNSALYKQWNS